MTNKLGKTIRILRQARDLKLSQVAADAGVSVPFLSLVESGSRQPSLEVLQRIASCLSVPIDVLISIGTEDGECVPKRRESVQLADTIGKLFDMEQRLRELLVESGKDGARKGQRKRDR